MFQRALFGDFGGSYHCFVESGYVAFISVSTCSCDVLCGTRKRTNWLISDASDPIEVGGQLLCMFQKAL